MDQKNQHAFSFQRADEAKFEQDGLRGFFAYRDLGIKEATCGQFGAHVIKTVQPFDAGAGKHKHELNFQMVYVLKGSCCFWYEGQGEIKMSAGDCVYQPPGIKHEVISISEDCELLEIVSPAEFGTQEE